MTDSVVSSRERISIGARDYSSIPTNSDEGVMAQLARRLKAWADGLSGSATYAFRRSPGSAVSAMDSYDNVISPTSGWWKRLMPVRCWRTSCAAHSVRNRSLRVDSSPTSSVRPWSYGFSLANVRSRAAASPATFDHSMKKSCDLGSRNTNRATLGRPGISKTGAYSALPSVLVARMSMRALRTYAAAPVMESNSHWTGGRTVRRAGRPAATLVDDVRARSCRWARSASSSCRAVSYTHLR